MCFGRDFISLAPPAEEGGKVSISADPWWKCGTRGRHIESSLVMGVVSSDPNTQRSWRLVLGFASLALCHICNPLCKVFVFSVFSSIFYPMLLIHQCHPCQWFMDGSYSQTSVCVAFETIGVVWVTPFLWCEFEKDLPGLVGRSKLRRGPIGHKRCLSYIWSWRKLSAITRS